MASFSGESDRLEKHGRFVGGFFISSAWGVVKWQDTGFWSLHSEVRILPPQPFFVDLLLVTGRIDGCLLYTSDAADDAMNV